MCGVLVCLHAPTLDLGEGGERESYIWGCHFITQTPEAKKGFQRNHVASGFAFSFILPIHGLPHGAVSPAKEPQTLKHREE